MFRLIARLDVKAPNLVKGIRLEGLRIIGRPDEYAQRYCGPGWELFYQDIVASLYGRNQLEDLLSKTASACTASGHPVPIAVGGGIKSVAEATRLFNAGADQVSVNTGAVGRPRLIEELSGRFGAQAVVLSVECRRTPGGWEAFTDNGRQATGLDVCRWVDEGVARGAGQIMLTSIDMEGTRKGFDLELIRAIAPHVCVPVIACGGCGSLHHLRACRQAGADGAAVSSVLHYNLLTIKEISDDLAQIQLPDEATSGS